MRNLMTSTLAVAAATFALEAHAQDTGIGTYSGIVTAEQSGNLVSAESLMDADIYTLNQEYDEATWAESEYGMTWNEPGYYGEVAADWENIGEVEDIVLSRDGQLIGIIAEVGGWLDIGDSNVLISLDDVRMVGGGAGEGMGAGGAGEGMGAGVSLVTRMSQEQLENMNSINEGWFD